jgi:D-apionolactonase
MNPDFEHILIYGTGAPLPERLPLRAGPLSVIFENGGLRYIRLGRQDLLLMVYAAVRDHNWGTVPGVISNLKIDAGSDSFAISYTSNHNCDDIAFTWQGTIIGQPDGTIIFRFDGQAGTNFRRNRIGFCVLHPINCAGQPCLIEHSSGAIEQGVFPGLIAPEQPFKDIRAITHSLASGLQVKVSFEGDVFEMEDQRNWTDASYKTYCTPLDRPYPVTVQVGERISQSVKLELVGPLPPPNAVDLQDEPVMIRFTRAEQPLPVIGLCIEEIFDERSLKEIERLQALRLAHFRVDVHFEKPDVWETLNYAAAQSQALSVPLEIALHLSDRMDSDLQALAKWVQIRKPNLVRWIIFHRGEKSTTLASAQAARDSLSKFGAPIGGGTDAFFTELNRFRPPSEALDFIAYSINPQVHAFDNASLVETLAAQSETVRSAQAFSGGLPVHVGPVSFKMRWNPNATAEEITPAGQLPPQVDPRQMSLFGAGWTVGSIKALAEAGAACLTYFAAAGWLGVMEKEDGSPLPHLFPSIPGAVFPLYHVFADLAEYASGKIVTTESTDQLRAEGLLVANGNFRRLMLANYFPELQAVIMPDIRQPVTARLLDQSRVKDAMQYPESFRSGAGREIEPGLDGLALSLPPYGYICLDWEES